MTEPPTRSARSGRPGRLDVGIISAGRVGAVPVLTLRGPLEAATAGASWEI